MVFLHQEVCPPVILPSKYWYFSPNMKSPLLTKNSFAQLASNSLRYMQKSSGGQRWERPNRLYTFRGSYSHNRGRRGFFFSDRHFRISETEKLATPAHTQKNKSEGSLDEHLQNDNVCPTNLQHATPALPVVTHIKIVRPVERLPTLVKMHSRGFLLFPSIRAETDDTKKRRDWAVPLATQLKFSLCASDTELLAKTSYKLQMLCKLTKTETHTATFFLDTGAEVNHPFLHHSLRMLKRTATEQNLSTPVRNKAAVTVRMTHFTRPPPWRLEWIPKSGLKWRQT